MTSWWPEPGSSSLGLLTDAPIAAAAPLRCCSFLGRYDNGGAPVLLWPVLGRLKRLRLAGRPVSPRRETDRPGFERQSQRPGGERDRVVPAG